MVTKGWGTEEGGIHLNEYRVSVFQDEFWRYSELAMTAQNVNVLHVYLTMAKMLSFMCVYFIRIKNKV